MVTEHRHLFGVQKARLLWVALGLPSLRESGPGTKLTDEISAHVSRFVAAELKAEQDAMLSARSVYNAYLAWAKKAGAPSLTLSMFGRKMALTGIRKHKTGGRVFYLARLA